MALAKVMILIYLKDIRSSPLPGDCMWGSRRNGAISSFENTSIDAVAAANIYVDQSVYLAKKFLYDSKINVRKPDLLTI